MWRLDASAGQPQRQCARSAAPSLELVEPRAVVPEDLALGLLRQVRELEESVDRVRIARVVVRPVGRHDEIVVADLGDDVLRQLLFRLDRDEALAPEELRRQRVLLELLAIAPRLPAFIERP